MSVSRHQLDDTVAFNFNIGSTTVLDDGLDVAPGLPDLMWSYTLTLKK
jgi:hypothetical protein